MFGSPPEITYEGKSRERIDEIFGRSVSKEDLGNLVGGVAGEQIFVRVLGSGKVRVESSGYREIHTRQRTIEKKGEDVILHNDVIVVRRGSPRGMGVRMLAQQVEAARNLGVKTIKAHADGPPAQVLLNGYYTWPRLGFEGPLPRGWAETHGFPEARKLSDLMRTEEGRKAWQANGVAVSVSFNPLPSSLSSRVLSGYLEEKGVRIR